MSHLFTAIIKFSNQGWELGKEIIVEQNTDVDFKLRNAQKLHRIGS